MWIILPLVLAVRRLPYTVRGSFSSLLLVHPSMEEAAANVGATKLRTFRDITVPLVWKGHPGRRAVFLHHVDPGALGQDFSRSAVGR